MSELMKKFYTEMLLHNGVDIHNKYYKTSENYRQIKYDRMIGPDGSMSLEEFIERFLLTEQEVENTYDSIYDMGNPHILTDNECSDTSIAEDIEENINDKDSVEIVQSFHRAGGLIARLKTYLDFDLELFDKNNKQYNAERCKILYMFYMLEHKYFPKTNILMLLSKPSMESIDNLGIGINTPNGMVVKVIKDMLEKELPLHVKENIKKTVADIMSTWDKVIENAYQLTDFFYANNRKYSFDNTIKLLLSHSKDTDTSNTSKYSSQSPIETLYLKITTFEYICNIEDIVKTNSINKSYENNISPELIEEMIGLHYHTINIENIEQYVHENALRISKYVYQGKKASSDEIKRIHNAIKKIHKWFEFCYRVKPLLCIDDICNELQIVSFLQAVLLDDPNETFDNAYYGYQKFSKHPKRVNAALKNDDYVPQALQCYWNRKVTDRWYANLGRNDDRIEIRNLEMVYDRIFLEILKKSDLDEMRETHRFYLDNLLGDELLTTNEQIEATKHLQHFFHNKGFNYIDHYLLIRYVFLYPPEIIATYNALTELINWAIEDIKPTLKVECEISSANGKDKLICNIIFDFNYQNNECVLQDLTIKQTVID